MPHADGNEDWRVQLAQSQLKIADSVRHSATAYLREAEVDYGRKWAAALAVCTREELLAQGFEEPRVQCGRDPEKLKAMRSKAYPRDHPEFDAWLDQGREYTPPPETHPSLLEHTED